MPHRGAARMYQSDFPAGGGMRDAMALRIVPLALDRCAVVDKRVRADVAMPVHSHAGGCVVIVLAGELSERVFGATRYCPAGSVFVERPDERHTTTYGPRGARLLTFEYRDAAASELLRFGLEPREGMRAGLPALVDAFRGALTFADADRDLTLEQLESEVFATLTAARVVEERVARLRWLDRVRTRLHDTFTTPTSIAALAADAGVDPDHLSRAFRRTFSCDVGGYVRGLRIGAARRRLAAGNDAVTTIAADLGFVDASHFSRTFKRCVGMSPAAYRAATNPRAAS